MATYAYAWEYEVEPAQVDAFARTYGPEGEWVRLFRRAPGYVGTRLLRDRSDPLRFVTLDTWESESAWREFRARFAAEFEELDARCAAFTRRETEIGRFHVVE